MKTRRKIELGILLAIVAAIPAIWLWSRAATDELVDGLAGRGYVERACDRDSLPEYISSPRCFAGPVAVIALGGYHTAGKAPTRFMPTTQTVVAVVVPKAREAELPAPQDRVEVAGGKVALVWSEGHDWASVSRRLETIQSVQ